MRTCVWSIILGHVRINPFMHVRFSRYATSSLTLRYFEDASCFVLIFVVEERHEFGWIQGAAVLDEHLLIGLGWGCRGWEAISQFPLSWLCITLITNGLVGKHIFWLLFYLYRTCSFVQLASNHTDGLERSGIYCHQFTKVLSIVVNVCCLLLFVHQPFDDTAFYDLHSSENDFQSLQVIFLCYVDDGSLSF